MNRSNWKDIAELIGIAAIVASLVFVGLQMRQAHQIAVAETYLQETATTYARAELGAINAETVAKANREEDLTEAERFALDEYMRARWQHAFFSLAYQKLLDRETGGPVATFATTICRNPGLAEIWTGQSARMVENSGPDGQLTAFVNDVNTAVGIHCDDR